MFVELSPQVLVDPTEVAAVTSSDTGGTRIYMRGSGTRSYLEVGIPLNDVSTALMQALHERGAARPGGHVPSPGHNPGREGP